MGGRGTKLNLQASGSDWDIPDETPGFGEEDDWEEPTQNKPKINPNHARKLARDLENAATNREIDVVERDLMQYERNKAVSDLLEDVRRQRRSLRKEEL